MTVTANGLSAGTDYTLAITSSNGKISINNNGEITIDSTIARADAGNYTVTATGIGDYEGTVNVQVTLNVRQTLQNAGLTITKDTRTVTVGSSHPLTRKITVTATGLTAGTHYTLSITGRPPNATAGRVTIDDSGKITIATTIALDDDGEYTVTATGAGIYGGTVVGSFRLRVKETLAHAGLVINDGSKAVSSQSGSGTDRYTMPIETNGLTGGTHYTLAITPSNGRVSIDNNGVITITLPITSTELGGLHSNSHRNRPPV